MNRPKMLAQGRPAQELETVSPDAGFWTSGSISLLHRARRLDGQERQTIGERLARGVHQRESRAAHRLIGIDHRTRVIEIVESLGQIIDIIRD